MSPFLSAPPSMDETIHHLTRGDPACKALQAVPLTGLVCGLYSQSLSAIAYCSTNPKLLIAHPHIIQQETTRGWRGGGL